MKVLFLTTWFPYPPDNGSKIRVYHLLQTLSCRHQVTLCSFAFDTAQPEAAVDLRNLCRDVEVVNRDPFDRSSLARLLRFFSLVPIVERSLPEMTRLVAQLAEREKYDVVVASTTGMASYAMQVDCAIKVLEEHNAPSRVSWERYKRTVAVICKASNWVSFKKRALYDRRLLRKFDLCTMVSQEDREFTQKLVDDRGCRVEVVPNGIDCQYNKPTFVPVGSNRIIYNGALTYSANYDAMRYFLREIYPLIRDQHNEVSLTITGSTKGVDLTTLMLDESVSLSGYVDDIRPLVAGSAVCVVPLRIGGGTRLKLLESMALGTPVVSTSKGAEGLDVVNGEHLLIADTPADFATCTLRLLCDTRLRRRLAINARQLVEEKYDWKQIGQRFVDLVEDVASNK